MSKVPDMMSRGVGEGASVVQAVWSEMEWQHGELARVAKGRQVSLGPHSSENFFFFFF